MAQAIAATRRCPRLPDVAVPEAVRVVESPRELAAAARFLVIAVTSTDVGPRLVELGAVLDGSHLIVHAVGALAAPDDVRVSELIERATPVLRSGVLAGPALPGDLAAGRFASMVVASAFDEVAAEARRLLNLPPALRLYGSRDVIGVELASALAGAYTAALGLADGAKVGVGPRAVLVTPRGRRGSALEAMGGQARTFAGLAGLGNLLVRGASGDDPDYAFGQALARGDASAARTTEGARGGDRAAARRAQARADAAPRGAGRRGRGQGVGGRRRAAGRRHGGGRGMRARWLGLGGALALAACAHGGARPATQPGLAITIHVNRATGAGRAFVDDRRCRARGAGRRLGRAARRSLDAELDSVVLAAVDGRGGLTASECAPAGVARGVRDLPGSLGRAVEVTVAGGAVIAGALVALGEPVTIVDDRALGRVEASELEGSAGPIAGAATVGETRCAASPPAAIACWAGSSASARRR